MSTVLPPRARVVQFRDGSYVVELLWRTPILRRPRWFPLVRGSRYEVTTFYGCAQRFTEQWEAEAAAREAQAIYSRPERQVVSEIS